METRSSHVLCYTCRNEKLYKITSPRKTKCVSTPAIRIWRFVRIEGVGLVHVANSDTHIVVSQWRLTDDPCVIVCYTCTIPPWQLGFGVRETKTALFYFWEKSKLLILIHIRIWICLRIAILHVTNKLIDYGKLHRFSVRRYNVP